MKQISPFWLGLIVGIFVVTIFLSQFLAHLTEPLSLSHIDAIFVNFILKHYMNIFFSGNWGEILNMPMFYGFNNSLLFSDHHFIQALEALPIFFVSRNIILTSNLLSYLTILASFLSMYYFVFYLTKKATLSILASIIFVLNPYVSTRFPDYLIGYSLQWIPLIFLFLEKSFEKPTNRNLFLFFFFLTCQFLSALYYSVFLSIILPIYLIAKFLQTKTSPLKMFNLGSIIGGILFLTILIGTGYLYSNVYPKQLSKHGEIQTTEKFSAHPIDLFLNPYERNFLHSLFKDQSTLENTPQNQAKGVVDVFVYERTYFWGITVWSLFLIGIVITFRSKNRGRRLLYFGIITICIILSFGPTIILSENAKFSNYFYNFIQFIDPALSYLRVPARFGAFIFFFLSLFIVLNLQQILNKYRFQTWIIPIISLIILVEYWNNPLTFTQITPQERSFYNVLNNQPQIKVIVDLPAAIQLKNNSEGFHIYDPNTHYLLPAAVLHSKILLNGYNGFVPDEYTRRLAQLSAFFPQRKAIELLRSWGVEGIVLHKAEFSSTGEFYFDISSLKSLGIKEIAETKNLALFDLTK